MESQAEDKTAQLSADARAAHASACLAGDDFYVDPDTGMWVATRDRLLRQGGCCESGCRHCPHGFRPRL